ncbi:MAG: ion transporter [Opitutaceae bacterium]|nr:ion transporter [Opitutaceae bacterium]
MSSPAPGLAADEELGPFQFSVLVMSVLALVAITADAFLALPPEVSRILRWVDHIACAAFFCDFVIRYRRAESKLAFMKWGWIDLLASVPNVGFLRLGRFVRVLVVIRLIRGIGTLHRFLALMKVTRRRGGAATVALVMFLVVTFASTGILLAETSPNSNIKTAGDAVWWSVTTITTVGYGDRYPVTAAGRVIAMFLMFSGVGLFGALSGIIASNFLGEKEREEAILAEVRALRVELAERGVLPSRREPPSD